MKINLRDVQYFAAIGEHQHLGRAAEALGLSQPALSMILRRLERSMNTKLVTRTPKGVDLTASGDAVYEHARQLRLTADDISREIADLSLGQAGSVRISTAPAFVYHLVPMACEVLHKQAPKVSLQVTTEDRATRMASLRNGMVDIAVTTIVPPHYEELTEEHLFDEDYVIFGAASHPLARLKRLTLNDLVSERWAMSAVNDPAWRRLCEAFNTAVLPSPKIGIATSDLPLRHRMVAASRMLAFASNNVTRYAATRFAITQFQVKDFSYTRRVGVFYRKDAYLSPAARRFIDILKTTAKAVASGKS